MKTKSIFNGSGVYRITNNLNNKHYVGSAVNIRKRWKSHRNLLRKGIHHNPHLQSAFYKYGMHNFMFEVIEFVVGENKEWLRENLMRREEYWIHHYNSHNRTNGYNMSSCARGPLGVRPTPESIKRMSEAHLGKRQSEETKQKISISQYKPVYQIDANGNTVKKFSSCIEAEKKTSIPRQHISMVCRGVIKFARGFQWCYEESIKNFKSKMPKKSKPIRQIHADGTQTIWRSIKEASEKIGIEYRTLQRKLKRGIEFQYE